MPLVLDIAPFAAELRSKVHLSTAGMADIVNHSMKNVLFRAAQFSPMADPAAIAAQLQILIGHRTTGRGGRPLRHPRAITKPTDLARGIIMARLWRHGVNPHSLSGGELDQMVKRLITNRRRSVGYLKSGYLPAARLFQARVSGVSQFGPDRGTGRLANLDDLVATLENDVPLRWASNARAYPLAEASVQQAFDYVAADLRVYVDRKLTEAGFNLWR